MATSKGEYSTATANKEEAIRAKELALQKLEEKDWAGAKRLLQKAQRLCADLDGVSSCIVIAEVHIIADATSHPSPLRERSRDYYAILDVRPDVTKQALIQQYKKRAFQLHPDKNQYPGAEAAFKLLGEAFEILKDESKRRKYDYQRVQAAAYQSVSRNGHTQVPPSFPRASAGPSAPPPFAYSQNFGNYPWANIFGGGRAPEPTPTHHPPPQRASNGYAYPSGGGPTHVPRDSSGKAFTGYNVNGSPPPLARQPASARPANAPNPQPVFSQARPPQQGYAPQGPHQQRSAPVIPPPQSTSAQINPPQPSFAQQPRPVVQPDERFISVCGSCRQRYTFPIGTKGKFVRCQKCGAAFSADEEVPAGTAGGLGNSVPQPQKANFVPPPQFVTTTQAAPVPPPAANGAPRPNAPATSRVATVEMAWAEAVKMRTDFQKVQKREAKQQRKEEKAARERELERHMERKEKARKLRAERKDREAEERASKQKEDAALDKPAFEAVDARVLEEGKHIPLRRGSKPVNVDWMQNEKGTDPEHEPSIRPGRQRQAEESGDEPLMNPGNKRPAEEMDNGVAEESRKRRKVCIDLDDEIDEPPTDPTVAHTIEKARSDTDEAASMVDEGGREKPSEADLDASDGTVLPGRREEKHRCLEEILSVGEDLAPRLVDEPREQPFLVPASGVNVPFAVGKDALEGKGKAVEGGSSHSTEEKMGAFPPAEGGPSNGEAGDHSHRQSDGVGQSSVNDLEEQPIPDTIFFDFDQIRKESDVQAGQFWALYDEVDGMPRFYGRVDSVKHNPFLVELTWLEATDSEREAFHSRDNLLWERQISPGVGRYAWGVNTQIDSVNIFAYQQTAITPTSEGAKLYPRCGEVWAMFRLGKQIRKDKEKKDLRYDVVEIVGAGAGYMVTKLVRIPNHSTLYQAVRDPCGEPQRSHVKTIDAHLFSHRVLGKKVPPHLVEQKVELWELDPAGLPIP